MVARLILTTRIICGCLFSAFDHGLTARTAHGTAQELGLLVGWHGRGPRLTPPWRFDGCDRFNMRHYRLRLTFSNVWTLDSLDSFGTFNTLDSFWSLGPLTSFWPLWSVGPLTSFRPLKARRARRLVGAKLCDGLVTATVKAALGRALTATIRTIEPFGPPFRPALLIAAIVGAAIAARLPPRVGSPEILTVLTIRLEPARFTTLVTVTLIAVAIVLPIGLMARTIVVPIRPLVGAWRIHARSLKTTRTRSVKASRLGFLPAHHRLAAAIVVIVVFVGEFPIDRRIA